MRGRADGLRRPQRHAHARRRGRLCDGPRGGPHRPAPRRKGGLGGGIFAAFTGTPGYDSDSGELAAPIGQDLATGLVSRTIGRLLRLEREGHLRLARAPGDLDAARAANTLAAVAHIEGAEAVDPELLALDALHAAGLRSLGPVWSRPNAFAYGVPFAFPSSPDAGRHAARAPLRRARDRGRSQPPQRGGLLGRRQARPGAADRLALRRARPVRLQ